MTPGDDNAIIWLIRLTDKDGNILRAATQDITLDANDYDGEVMGINQRRFSLNELGKRINIVDDGTTGEVSTVIFTIARHTSNTYTNDFINEYYPATSGKTLVGATIESGMVWDTATTESEITWLHQYNVDDYSYSTSEIQLINSEFSEFELVPLPYYKIQSETDNGVSYFPDAQDDSLGLSIPFVYGDFTNNKSLEDRRVGLNYRRVPAVQVSERTRSYLIASHEFHTSSYNELVAGQWAIYKYIPGFKTYMIVYKTANSSGVNSKSRYSVDVGSSTDYYPIGQLFVRLKVLGSYTDTEDINEATDDDRTTYSVLEADASGTSLMALRTSGVGNRSDIGILGNQANDIIIIWEVSSDDSGDRDYGINIVEFSTGTPVGGTGSTGTITTGTTLTDKSWAIGNAFGGVSIDIEDLCARDFVFNNRETGAGDDIRVYNAFLQLANINVLQLKTNRPRYRNRTR